MLPKIHILFGLAFSILFFLIFPSIGWIGFSIIFLSSFLIDIDHFLYYVYKTGKWGIIPAYNWFLTQRKKWLKLSLKEQAKYARIIMLFHGIEFILILLLLLFVNNIFLFILIGILFHLVLDFYELHKTSQPFYLKTSQVYNFFENKNKKKLM